MIQTVSDRNIWGTIVSLSYRSVQRSSCLFSYFPELSHFPNCSAQNGISSGFYFSGFTFGKVPFKLLLSKGHVNRRPERYCRKGALAHMNLAKNLVTRSPSLNLLTGRGEVTKIPSAPRSLRLVASM